jgi:hypothetical protein
VARSLKVVVTLSLWANLRACSSRVASVKKIYSNGDERKLAPSRTASLSYAGEPIFLFSRGLAAAEPRAFEGLVDRRALDAQAAGRFADVAPDEREDAGDLRCP